MEDLADRSNGEKILGLGIFETRVTLANASDEAILQYHLIQEHEGLIRLKKKRDNDVRKDHRLPKGDENQSLGNGITF
jgi:hypothetical protein